MPEDLPVEQHYLWAIGAIGCDETPATSGGHTHEIHLIYPALLQLGVGPEPEKPPGSTRAERARA